MSLVFDFGQGVRYDAVCTLDTAAVTELWRLELFSCTSSSFLCAGTLTNSRGSRVAGRESTVAVAGPKSRSRVQCRGRGSNVAAGENDLGFEVTE